MPTPAQEAFAEGFAALLEDHGQTWSFGAASFAGVASVLKSDDPRLLGSPDRHIELQVSTSALPFPRPKRSDEIIQDGVCYRIIRGLDVDLATGLTTILAVYVGERPSITTQPESISTETGETVAFTVVASGVPSPVYQWKKDGDPITGATGSTLELSDISGADEAAYTVTVTNSFGTITSDPATLTIPLP